MIRIGLVTAAVSLAAGAAAADDMSVAVDMHRISAAGVHESIGAITLTGGHHGLKLSPALEGLSPGAHAFHFHENADCGPGEKNGMMVAGLAAGAHLGHMEAMSHGSGHDEHQKPKGDLAELVADADGTANQTVMAGHLSLDEVRNAALMIHEKSEADGGGARIACGIVP